MPPRIAATFGFETSKGCPIAKGISRRSTFPGCKLSQPLSFPSSNNTHNTKQNRSRARNYSSHDVLELFAGSGSSAKRKGGGSVLDFNQMQARGLLVFVDVGGEDGG